VFYYYADDDVGRSAGRRRKTGCESVSWDDSALGRRRLGGGGRVGVVVSSMMN